jgi:hypothetical protein
VKLPDAIRHAEEFVRHWLRETLEGYERVGDTSIGCTRTDVLALLDDVEGLRDDLEEAVNAIGCLMCSEARTCPRHPNVALLRETYRRPG